MAIQVTVLKGEVTAAAVDFIVVATAAKGLKTSQPIKDLDGALDGVLLASAAEQDFSGKPKQRLTLHTHGKIRAKRVCLFGVGDEQALTAGAVLDLAAQATRLGNRVGARKVLLVAPLLSDARYTGSLVARGAVLGGYQFNGLKSDKGRKPTVQQVQLHVGDASLATAAKAGCARGVAVAEGVAAARDLANTPAIDLTPEIFARRASQMARNRGLTYKAFTPPQLKRMGLNLLLGVGAGSEHPPRLVHLSYTPPATKGKRPYVLVGKGITFDSGGLSLKSPGNMVDMKFDMSGAAAVFGAMDAVGQLKPKVPVHGILALAENMPSGTAIRPGDVLRSGAGKTVEINNTDAEGRLVLADALHYAKKLKPGRMIDLATLTGACVVALGPYTSALFANQDNLAQDLLSSAQRAGEDFWRMPLSKPLKEQLQSDVADMKNTGERWGGAITAALFLEEFAGSAPWAHLDIAGPASSTKEQGLLGKGGTGVGVATLADLICEQ